MLVWCHVRKVVFDAPIGGDNAFSFHRGATKTAMQCFHRKTVLKAKRTVYHG